jgi:hypothetical protein
LFGYLPQHDQQLAKGTWCAGRFDHGALNEFDGGASRMPSQYSLEGQFPLLLRCT